MSAFLKRKDGKVSSKVLWHNDESIGLLARWDDNGKQRQNVTSVSMKYFVDNYPSYL